MRTTIIAVLLLASAQAMAGNAASITPEDNGVPQSGGVVVGTFVGSCPTASGAHGFILDINGVQGCVLNSNIAATGMVIHPEDNYPAGSQVAAALAVRGGIDERNITMTRANCSAVTVTVVTSDYTATYTTTVFTEDGVGGTSTTWNRGATDATAATNLAAKINALTGTAGVSATASSNVISVVPDRKVMTISITTSGASCAAIASATDAPINLNGQININGSTAAQVQYVLLQPTVGMTFGQSTSKIVYGTFGSLNFVADGKFTINTNAGTNGTTLSCAASSLQVRNQADSAYEGIGFGTSLSDEGGVHWRYLASTPGFNFGSATRLSWGTTDSYSSTLDVGLDRTAAGTLRVTNGQGAAGGDLQVSSGVISASTQMTATNSSILRETWHRFDWTLAQVQSIGASVSGDLTVATLPAKTVVKRALIVITTPETTEATLTVAVGITSATYLDYVVASDAKAAANTVYGDLQSGAETGTKLFDATAKWTDNVPSWTGTTAVKAHFIGASSLSGAGQTAGSVYLLTSVLP